MRHRRSLLVLVLAVLELVAVAPSALALAPAAANCLKHDDHLTRHFTVRQLESAYNSMPAVDKEYNGCASVIENQITVELRHEHVKRASFGSSAGGSSSTTILIVIVVVVVGAGGGLALLAGARRRRS